MLRIYLKNIPAKYDPNPTWNDGTSGFLKTVPQQELAQEQQDG